MKTFYQHFRQPTEDGEISNLGGITYGFVIDGDQVHFAAAVCSPKDNYDKKVGRRLVDERLKQYLDGKQVVTAESPEGRYPLAFTLGADFVFATVVALGAFEALTKDATTRLVGVLKLTDLNLQCVIAAIDLYFQAMYIPFKE